MWRDAYVCASVVWLVVSRHGPAVWRLRGRDLVSGGSRRLSGGIQ